MEIIEHILQQYFRIALRGFITITKNISQDKRPEHEIQRGGIHNPEQECTLPPASLNCITPLVLLRRPSCVCHTSTQLNCCTVVRFGLTRLWDRNLVYRSTINRLFVGFPRSPWAPCVNKTLSKITNWRVGENCSNSPRSFTGRHKSKREVWLIYMSVGKFKLRNHLNAVTWALVTRSTLKHKPVH